jgi:hypothetical protein
MKEQQMATNGQTTNDQDQEVFRGIERAITGAVRARQIDEPQPGDKAPAIRPPDAEPITGSITETTEELAEQYRALGRHALEHGQYIHQACNEHADRLLSDNRKLASTVLTAERKLVSDAESFIGSARG